MPLIAVSIQVDYNQLLRRITGRRNCPVCQTIHTMDYKNAYIIGVMSEFACIPADVKEAAAGFSEMQGQSKQRKGA